MGKSGPGRKRKRTTRSAAKVASQDSEGELVIDESEESNVKKRVGGIRFSDEPVDITCTWLDCSRRFTDYIEYIHHGEDHALSVEGNDMGRYPCGYEGCSHQATHLLYLAKHVAFHVYHDRLKNVGNNVLSRFDLPKCFEGVHFEIPAVDYDYECKWDSCTYISGTLHEYMAHVQMHLKNVEVRKNTPFFCKWITCKGKYNTQAKLVEHVRSHTKEKMTACPTCGAMFASNTKFIDHRKRQIPLELHSFQCSECYKLFATERLLRDHVRQHISHFKCSLCDMTTNKRGELARHIRIRHLDERNFKCTLCEHACVSKYNLEQHLVTHCAEKLMACEECNFRCRSVYGLDRHYQLVHGQGSEPVYECHYCKVTYHRGGILSKHLMERHGLSWPSGHSRFRYKVCLDGIYRLNTVRYESLEVSQEDSTCAPPIDKDIKYNIKKQSITKEGIISFELAVRNHDDEESKNSEDVDEPSEFEDVEKKFIDVSENRGSSSIKEIDDENECSLKIDLDERMETEEKVVTKIENINDDSNPNECSSSVEVDFNEHESSSNLEDYITENKFNSNSEDNLNEHSSNIDDDLNETTGVSDGNSDEDEDYINEEKEVDDEDYFEEDYEENNEVRTQVGDVIITITDVDEKGNIINSEIVNNLPLPSL